MMAQNAAPLEDPTALAKYSGLDMAARLIVEGEAELNKLGVRSSPTRSAID